MRILMEAPAKFIAGLASGEYSRSGAILREVASGRIVGHLKETGQMGTVLSKLASAVVNPLSTGINVSGHVINGRQLQQLRRTTAELLEGVTDLRGSVAEIAHTLEGLQLITSAAAVFSLAGLGVSVAGFARVNRSLARIDAKVDGIADDVGAIKAALGQLHIGWEAMSTATLREAAEKIVIAEQASTAARRHDLVGAAADDFSRLRHYCAVLLSQPGLFEDSSLDLKHLHELVARYTFAGLGELQAEFMTGDLGSYRQRLQHVLDEFPRVVSFQPRAMYQRRCDELANVSERNDYRALSESIGALDRHAAETLARMESHQVELEYLETNNLSAQEYLSALQACGTGVVLLPR